MHDLMAGMFWGGLLMAMPPVLLGVGVAVFLIRQRSQATRARDRVSE
jgi:hypothetical protein